MEKPNLVVVMGEGRPGHAYSKNFINAATNVFSYTVWGAKLKGCQCNVIRFYLRQLASFCTVTSFISIQWDGRPNLKSKPRLASEGSKVRKYHLKIVNIDSSANWRLRNTETILVWNSTAIITSQTYSSFEKMITKSNKINLTETSYQGEQNNQRRAPVSCQVKISSPELYLLAHQNFFLKNLTRK